MVLTIKSLKKIIKEELEKLKNEAAGDLESVEDSCADEVQADEYATTPEHHIDFYKANKIKEAKALDEYRKLRERNAKIREKIVAGSKRK